MREPEGTLFIIGTLIVCAIIVTIIGLGHEMYLQWYINQ